MMKLIQLLESHQMKPVCMPLALRQQKMLEINPQELMRVSLHEVRDSKLVVVDLTEKGVGIGIEAGYAHSRGIPIVTLAQNGKEVSESLEGISDHICHYRNWEDVEQFLTEIAQIYLPS